MKILSSTRKLPIPNQNLATKAVIFAAAILSLITYFALRLSDIRNASSHSDKMMQAAQIMASAITTIREYYDASGLCIDTVNDPNRTGLIGSEISPIATTLGNIEAKRTTTNPNFAAVIVHLLDEAGVAAGDTIAIGCSASFPALMIASLAAAQAMEVFPIIIISLGSSSFGATNPEFNLLDIYQLLLEKKIISVPPAAVTLGGDQDIGRDFEASMQTQLIEQIRSSGLPFILEADLPKNVACRMKIYEGNSLKNRVSAFINIGGSYANIGTSALVLKVQPGLNRRLTLPASAERGVLFEMAERKVPIIHLLFIKGLALKYGLPWDPIPLPQPGQFQAFSKTAAEKG